MTDQAVETRALLSSLMNDIRRARAKRDVPYRRGLTKWPPLAYEQIGGLWPSDQVPYIAGPSAHPVFDHALALLRRADACVDYNFYVNVWVIQNILQAQQLGAELNFTDAELAPAAAALTSRFRDPAAPASSAIFFWPKRVPGPAGDQPGIYPTNLSSKFSAIAGAARTAFSVLHAVGLGAWANRTLHLLTPMRLDNIMRTLKIPADADDSALYLSVGLYLQTLAGSHPQARSRWDVDPADFAAQLVRCAYRPFSSDRGAASIDTRSYFWMRGFLGEVHREASAAGVAPDLALVTTWMQTYEETRRAVVQGNGAYVTPLYMNNVDMAVSANAVHALTYALVHEESPAWFSASVEKLYADTVRLLAWSITSGMINERTDLALLYYPDVHTFYWFVARTLGELRRSAVQEPRLRAVVKDAHTRLEAALSHATQWLLNSVGNDEQGLAYWDGVLGRGQDRLYITAATANALFEIWTDVDADGRLRYLPGTPAGVQRLLPRACQFLIARAASGELPWDNAFFSGSVKSRWTYHARYPANLFMYADGTPFDMQSTRLRALMSKDWTLGVTGFVPEEEYQRLIDRRQFNLECGTVRQPFSDFHYWSAPVVAQSICLLALSRYLLLPRLDRA